MVAFVLYGLERRPKKERRSKGSFTHIRDSCVSFSLSVCLDNFFDMGVVERGMDLCDYTIFRLLSCRLPDFRASGPLKPAPPQTLLSLHTRLYVPCSDAACSTSTLGLLSPSHSMHTFPVLSVHSAYHRLVLVSCQTHPLMHDPLRGRLFLVQGID